MPPKFKFTEGEKVLCFHGPLLYEAKLLRCAMMKEKQVKYLVHYAGWNKNWDEWVPESRVLKYNEANRQRQQEVHRLHSPLVKNKKSSTKGKKSDAQGGTGTQGKDSDSRASTPSKEVTKEKDTAVQSVTTTPVTGATTPTGTTSTGGSTTTPASSTGRNRSSLKTSATSASVSSSPSSSSSSTSSSTAVPAATDKPPAATSTAAGKDVKSSESKEAVEKPKDESSSEPGSSKAKKRGRSDTNSSNVESEDQFISKVEVKIKIPDELKVWLVDDWDAISRQNKLLELPAKVTVQEIVDNYVQYKKQSKVTTVTKETAVADIGNGIVEYFNVMLGSQLLYKFERPQYAEMIQAHPGVPMAKIYGSVHLLRLFVKLGPMLAFTSLDEKSIQTSLGHVQDFLKYLVKNSSTLFNMQHYVNTSPEYHRKAL
ncbi:AGAP001795-PA [Anopheles gambiae str. PEST]|uniref:Mortality factor 4-like protein 1 n=1 Tax=Anopheles gambiae TaxID=7165 RepID=Q7PY89_ANOGA|nr:mortality factor 4-like protein 1 [Anopheles gambiae]EAA01149.5 AGAP001795-PA [Anopheles gambiae str. PEST]